MRRDTIHLRESLTGRELDVLRLMTHGVDSRRIAELLGIRYGTVRSHVRNLIAKLGAHSKLEAVTRGLDLGLVDRAEGRDPLR
jgi:DNA-binding NarL/FixJ family response regulator